MHSNLYQQIVHWNISCKIFLQKSNYQFPGYLDIGETHGNNTFDEDALRQEYEKLDNEFQTKTKLATAML